MSRVESEKDTGLTAGSNGSMLDHRGGCSGLSSWCASSSFVLVHLCRQGHFAFFGSRRRMSRMIEQWFLR
jgi:hypothetical protein